MHDLLLNPETRRQLEKLVDSKPHAILLTGSIGAGKETIAITFLQEILNLRSVENAPYFTSLRPDGSSIGIEKIREVHSFLQLKTTGKGTIRRAVIINQADTMTDEAQNALLKALEEPPADTIIVLTAHNLQGLKQTIRSRVQQVQIKHVSLDDSAEFFASKFTHKDIAWAYALSDGQVGLMTALLEGQAEHPIAAHIETAKKLYGATAFERLAQVDAFAKDKESLPDLLFACKRICISALESSAKKGADTAVKMWHRQLTLVCEAEQSLQTNVNTKLLLTDLFVHM